ncbi:MAG: hypothetical protein R2705_04950 [Ilumatobacteraceae bacterium]
MFLSVVGWAFYPIWPADILHYYGVYLAIGAIALFTSNQRLITFAVGAVAASFVFIITFDPFKNWNLDDYSYRGITTAEGFAPQPVRRRLPSGSAMGRVLPVRHVVRTDLRNPIWRRTLATRAAIIVVATEAAAWIVLGPKGSNLDDLDDQSWRWLFSVEPIPPLPLYVAAGAGTAVLVIIGSIWFSEHLSAGSPSHSCRPANSRSPPTSPTCWSAWASSKRWSASRIRRSAGQSRRASCSASWRSSRHGCGGNASPAARSKRSCDESPDEHSHAAPRRRGHSVVAGLAEILPTESEPEGRE